MLATFLVLLLPFSQATFQFLEPCEQVGQYEYCEVKVDGYPEPVAIISPQNEEIYSVKVHWHGYILDPTSPFDRSLKSYVETLSLLPTVNGERVIIPKSVGKCETFFKNVTSLNAFLESLKDFIPEKSEIELSAHSGSGAFIAQLLTNEEIKNLIGVHYVDALYADVTVEQIKKWKLAHPKTELSVSYVKGTTTAKYSEALLGSLKNDRSVRSYKLDPFLSYMDILPHYFVIKDVWPFL